MADHSDLRTWTPPDDADAPPSAKAAPAAGPGPGRGAGARGSHARSASRPEPRGLAAASRARPLDEGASLQATAPPPRMPLPSWIGPANERAAKPGEPRGLRGLAITEAPAARGARSGAGSMPPDDGWGLELDQLLESADATVFHWEASSEANTRPAPPPSFMTAPPSQRPSVSASPARGPAITAAPARGPAITAAPARGPAITAAPARGLNVAGAPSKSLNRAGVPSKGLTPTAPPAKSPNVAASAAKSPNVSAPPPRARPTAAGALLREPLRASSGPGASVPPGPRPSREAPAGLSPSRGPTPSRRAPTPPPLPAASAAPLMRGEEPVIMLSTFPPPPSPMAMLAAEKALPAIESIEPDDDDSASAQDWAAPEALRLPAPPRSPDLGAHFAAKLAAPIDDAPPARESVWGSSRRAEARPGGRSEPLDLVVKDPFPAPAAPARGAAGAPAAPAAPAIDLTDDEIAAVHGRTLWARLKRRRR